MKKLAQVFHFDLYGKREDKYDFLNENSLATIAFTELNPQEPELFFVPKDFDSKSVYDEGFSVNELFKISSLGVQTHRDNFAISINKNEVKNRIIDFYNKAISNSDLINKYNLKETSEWKLNQKRDNNFDEKLILKIGYRPFDNQFIYNDKNIVDRLRDAVSKHIINKDNLCLVVSRQCVSDWRYIFLSKFIVESNLTSTAGRFGSGNFFPLYLYPETNAQQTLHGNIERTPNFNLEIVKQLAEGLGLIFANKKTTPPVGHPSSGGEFAPIDVLDYIYAVLHSPTYREKYAAFLKIDFPRVPYPKNKDTFWQLVKLGGEIRQIHLLESAVVDNYMTQYPIDGDNIVVKPKFENSPPLEGCPQGGVVPDITYQDPIIPHTFIKNNSIFFNPILELPYNIKLKSRVKELRQAENLSEVLFWMQVNKNQFYKIDFDRQRIIGNYIVDFYVKKLGLVIEIDGSSHDSKVEYDKLREEYLLSLGLKMYRIPVIEVLQNMKSVMRNLEAFIIENYGKPSVSIHKYKEPTRPPHPAGTPPQEGNLGKVYINESQYFANVPEVAWNFYIGGYQPAQKWLKDRKGRELTTEDIFHYQKIIVALSETNRIMKEIDKIDF